MLDPKRIINMYSFPHMRETLKHYLLKMADLMQGH